jgi:hypothetical protein
LRNRRTFRDEREALNGLLGRALWGSKLGDRPAILAAIADDGRKAQL